MNDYEIVKEAGLGIAMGNAIEELKAAADYVTAEIGDDGIYRHAATSDGFRNGIGLTSLE